MASEIKFKETEIGMIPEDWEIKNVEEITDTVCVGFVGTCLQYYCDQSEGIPMIRTTNLTDSGVCYSDLKYVTKEFHNKNKKSQLKKGDLVVARHGDNGKICIFEEDFKANCLNIVKIRPNNTKCNNKYLHYAFKNNLVLHQISSSVVGSVQGVLNTKTIAKLKIPLPSIEEQTKIISILKSLDDKIDLNRQMNSTLEQIAQSLFKRWFIDFEFPDENGNPYKSSGGRMVDSELGEIPEGWRIKSLYDCAQYINGSAFKSEDFSLNKEGLPIIKISELKNGITSQTEFTKKEFDQKYRITNGEILFSWSGSPDTSIDIFLWAGGTGWLNQHTFRVITQKEEKEFVFFLLKYLKRSFIEIARNKQTTGLGHVTSKDLKNMFVALPNKDIIKKLNIIGGPMIDEIFLNSIESNNISQIRDSLLPKLMSGKIRVQD